MKKNVQYTLVVDSPRDRYFVKQILESYGIETTFIESGDKTNQDFFAVVRWHEDDVSEVLSRKGLAPSKDNVEKVMARASVLRDRSTEEGWAILEDIVSDLKYDKELESLNL